MIYRAWVIAIAALLLLGGVAHAKCPADRPNEREVVEPTQNCALAQCTGPAWCADEKVKTCYRDPPTNCNKCEPQITVVCLTDKELAAMVEAWKKKPKK